MEELFEIPNYPDYKITKSGKVFGCRYERFLAEKIDKYGYIVMRVIRNKNYRNTTLHRLLAETFIPNPLGLPIVNHKDGNKLNNSLENLEWCTQGDNNIHALKTGLRVMENLSVKYIKNLHEIHDFQSVNELIEFLEERRNNLKINIIMKNKFESSCGNGGGCTTHEEILPIGIVKKPL